MPIDDGGMVGGNTISPTIKARTWCFTLNHPTPKEVEDINQYLNAYSTHAAYQSEVGEEGTPHLQGCFKTKNPVRFRTLKSLLPRAHWEKCRNWKASAEYCQKAETRVEGPSYLKGFPKPVKDPLDGLELHAWQQDLKNILDEEPDDRSIFWYWEYTGNTGKSAFCKSYILNNREDAIMVGGTTKDILFAVSQCTAAGKPPRVVFIDVARSKDHLAWDGIEKLKNGCFFSGKYESAQCLLNPPHIVLFANRPPVLDTLSADRWKVVEIKLDA